MKQGRFRKPINFNKMQILVNYSWFKTDWIIRLEKYQRIPLQLVSGLVNSIKEKPNVVLCQFRSEIHARNNIGRGQK